MVHYYCYNNEMFIALMDNDLGTALFSYDGELKCGDMKDNPQHLQALEQAEEITPNEFYSGIKPAKEWTEKEIKAFIIFKKSVAFYHQMQVQMN